ncbi:putative sporulation protein YtxC [Paenibacillus lutrae]|uniref:Sporulation protein n=1 Tax=Paenibacillus lutrae TaxID=2078573 RepID=A0A7X3FFX3_9BACL|nr:putative sporulation protein YtxC [Paenibacillus lutrae]MVO98993.1 sporulation protein [Paenibacillus lutrae]
MSFVTFVFSNSAAFDIMALQHRLDSRLTPFQSKHLHISTTLDHLKDSTELHIHVEQAGKQHVKKDVLLEAAAEACAEQIVEVEEEKLIRRLLVHSFNYEDEAEIKQIGRYCSQFLNGEATAGSEGDPETYADMLTWEQGDGVQLRRSKISEPLAAYLKETPIINLPGFIAFRLQAYTEEIREVIEYAIDEYVMDRQYQEFISLLQYFVYIQETKTEAAHLIHKGGAEFIILDEHMKPIDTDKLESSFTLEMLEKDISFEDMIVSTLISVSPATIYIHTSEPDLPVIRTITQIFESRTSICSYCSVCRALLAGNSHSGPVIPLT